MIHLLTLDLIGRLHTLSISASNLGETLVANGAGFDGSSYGFRKVEDSDMIITPDIHTMRENPFGDVPSLTSFTRILLADEKPFHSGSETRGRGCGVTVDGYRDR